MSGAPIAVVDLGCGDAGKGLVVDHLARSHPGALVVRFNGGAQAGHNVVTPDGRHHTFSQIGAGSFVPGVRTHLAARVVVHPTALLLEAGRLESAGVGDALDRLTVSDEALVVTPFHQAACRVRELARGGARHGSCGVGVGEVMRDSLAHPGDAVRVRDLAGAGPLRRRLDRVRERVRDDVRELRAAAAGAPAGEREGRVLDDPGVVDAWIDATRPFVARVRCASDGAVGAAVRGGAPVLFEGAQGVLLDEDHGFHPYTTWSRCTFANVDELLRDVAPGHRAYRLGVVRIYAHRHGPGPLPTESAELTAALDEPHNGDGPWQGRFRVGWPDLVMARYARAACGGIDALALTHLDAPFGPLRARIAPSYEQGRVVEWPAHAPDDLAGRAAATARLAQARPDLVEVEAREAEEALAHAYGAPVALRSTGPTTRHVESRWQER
jgi:adenylosuccinate synthase